MEERVHPAGTAPSLASYHVAAAADAGAPAWTPLRPGIAARELFDDGKGYRVVLLRYAPGAQVPDHLHTADEHAYVLEGRIRDGESEYGPGSYALNPAGTRHSLSSESGCLVLIHWLGPVRFPEGGTP